MKKILMRCHSDGVLATHPTPPLAAPTDLPTKQATINADVVQETSMSTRMTVRGTVQSHHHHRRTSSSSSDSSSSSTSLSSSSSSSSSFSGDARSSYSSLGTPGKRAVKDFEGNIDVERPIPTPPPPPPPGWSAGKLPLHKPPAPAPLLRGSAKGKFAGALKARLLAHHPELIWTCNICLEEFRGTRERVRCAQQHDYCKSCVGKYLRHCAQENKPVKCPMSFVCDTTFSMHFVKKYMPQDAFSSYMLRTEIQKVQPGDWVFRCCASVDCPGVLRIPKGKAPYHTICPCCDNTKCLSEKEVKVFTKVFAQDELTLEQKIDEVFLKTSTKPCPHCHKTIQKDEGCPHMSCVCGKSFCWNCGKKYDSRFSFLLGTHSSKYGYNGCPDRLFPNNRKACKATRGALLAGKTVALVTLGPPAVVVGGVCVGIPYGLYLGGKKTYHALKR